MGIENDYEDKNIEKYMNKFGYINNQRISVNDFYIEKNNGYNENIVNLKIWKFEDIKRSSDKDEEIADVTRKANVLN